MTELHCINTRAALATSLSSSLPQHAAAKRPRSKGPSPDRIPRPQAPASRAQLGCLESPGKGQPGTVSGRFGGQLVSGGCSVLLPAPATDPPEEGKANRVAQKVFKEVRDSASKTLLL